MPTFKKNTGFSLPGINFGTTGPTKTTPRSKTTSFSGYGYEKHDKE